MAPGSRGHSWKGEAASALLVTSGKLFASRAGSPVGSTPPTLLSSFAELHWARQCHLHGQGWRPVGPWLTSARHLASGLLGTHCCCPTSPGALWAPHSQLLPAGPYPQQPPWVPSLDCPLTRSLAPAKLWGSHSTLPHYRKIPFSVPCCRPQGGTWDAAGAVLRAGSDKARQC